MWGNRNKFESRTVWPYLLHFFYLPLVYSGKICPLIPFGKLGFFLLLFPWLFKEQEIVRTSDKVGGIQISPSPPRDITENVVATL